MSSPLNRLQQGSPEYRAEMIKFLEQQLMVVKKDIAIATKISPNAEKMIDLNIRARDIEDQIRRLRGR